MCNSRREGSYFFFCQELLFKVVHRNCSSMSKCLLAGKIIAFQCLDSNHIQQMYSNSSCKVVFGKMHNCQDLIKEALSAVSPKFCSHNSIPSFETFLFFDFNTNILSGWERRYSIFYDKSSRHRIMARNKKSFCYDWHDREREKDEKKGKKKFKSVDFYRLLYYYRERALSTTATILRHQKFSRK